MITVPEWCEWGRGDASVLLVAPHGGRRPPVDAAAPPPHLRVNDLYTPELTRALAARLGAGRIVNHGQDRNALDLNRISQVQRHAPWFLELLLQEIGNILERHACAEVVFIHGWNTGQAKCDIGIGATETPSGVHPAGAGAQLTVCEPYVRDRIAALRRAFAERMIAAPIGERYPGSHRNNVLQLFTSGRDGAGDAHRGRLATWVAEGRVNALQLELGIPLRWPGVWRERCIDAVVQAFEPLAVTGGARRMDAVAADGASPSAPAALQWYDAVADVGMFAGLGRIGPQSTAGRLLLFLGGQRIALFTGEEPARLGHGVPPLTLVADRDGMRLQFDGPMLLLDDAAAYIDVEAALASSRLMAARIDLQFQAVRSLAGLSERLHRSEGRAGIEFGAIHGSVALAGRERRINATGFANAGGLRASGARRQTMIAADFGGRRALLSRATDGDAASFAAHFTPHALHSFDGVQVVVTTDGDRYTPAMLELRCDGQPALRGWPLSRMAILRPTGPAHYVRVTFGVARFEWGGEQGYGLYEHARPIV